jgi:hypothetical protein
MTTCARRRKQRSNGGRTQENLTYSISNLDSEIIRLRSRVVQSPNRIKESLATQGAMLAKMKEEIVDLDRKALDHQARIKVIRTYEGVSTWCGGVLRECSRAERDRRQDITSLLKAVDEWEAELNRAAEEETKLSKLIEERDARSDEVRELELYAQVRVASVPNQGGALTNGWRSSNSSAVLGQQKSNLHGMTGIQRPSGRLCGQRWPSFKSRTRRSWRSGKVSTRKWPSASAKSRQKRIRSVGLFPSLVTPWARGLNGAL